MPIDISPTHEATYDFRHQPKNHVLARAHRLRGAWRGVRRRSVPDAPLLERPIAVDDAFDRAGEHLRTHGWAFIDPFFTPESHAAVVGGWPHRSFFAPIVNIRKSYDFGLRWTPTQTPRALDRLPALADTYRLLASEEHVRRVEALCGDGIARRCTSLLSTWASAGSALIPHRDSAAVAPGADAWLNFVIFVDGSGGPGAGGTSIIADADYRETIFEPTKLTNTALVYRLDEPFFHGFRPMRRGSWRWTVNAQYARA